MFPDLRNLPYLQRLEELKLWSLEVRRACSDLIEVYRIIKGASCVSFDTFFTFSSNRQTNGHSLKLAKKRVNSDLRHHLFSDRVINNWNSLDDRTVTSGTLNIFKNNLERLRSSRKMDLFVCIWCCLTRWGWAGALVRPRSVSYRWVIEYRVGAYRMWYATMCS